MPIKKFRSIEGMPEAFEERAIGEPPIERIRRLFALSWDLCPRTYPKGVFKFRSLEDAHAARERIEIESMRLLGRAVPEPDPR